eukprot:GFKZ01010151.1.p1 GENE.GFKZ01010151.1~~GFKZ01010151.1.p1  ORF type:complete len:415 (+),score=36.37 GFKZ01010151.1:202-1446(+)
MTTLLAAGGNNNPMLTFLPSSLSRLSRHQGSLPTIGPCRSPQTTAASYRYPRAPRVAPPGHPLSSLEAGQWFKLICGASSHDVPAIKNLCSVYTAAGADCIDVACDSATVVAAQAGIEEGLRYRESSYRPILMVSVNAGEDPHFRKAQFNASICPPQCTRPCESTCPAVAINEMGVSRDICYGCGRCVPVCPEGIIETVDYKHDVSAICRVLRVVDALEIHTGPQRMKAFEQLWSEVRESAADLNAVAVSLPDLGGNVALADGITGIWEILKEGVLADESGAKLIWQADGRPMSGDIGRGTAHAAVRLGKRMRDVLTSRGIPGEVQLAGGTNDATVPLLRKAGMLHGAREKRISGVAMGGFARKVIREVLAGHGGYDRPMSTEGFEEAVKVARELVYDIKTQDLCHLRPANSFT